MNDHRNRRIMTSYDVSPEMLEKVNEKNPKGKSSVLEGEETNRIG